MSEELKTKVINAIESCPMSKSDLCAVTGMHAMQASEVLDELSAFGQVFVLYDGKYSVIRG